MTVTLSYLQVGFTMNAEEASHLLAALGLEEWLPLLDPFTLLGGVRRAERQFSRGHAAEFYTASIGIDRFLLMLLSTRALAQAASRAGHFVQARKNS